MLQRLLISAVAGLAAVTAAAAQERPAEEAKRGAYVVKYAAAKDLAGLLAKHFKGAAEIQAGPEGTSRCLLINAPPTVFDEVLKTLEQLDRRPQSVTVEVLVIELPADKDKRPDEKQLSGTIDDVTTHLAAMQKKGEVAGYKGVELLTLEGQPGMMMLGENKPFALGPGQITYRNVGTQIKVTPQVAADQTVTLDLSVQDSRGRPSAAVKGSTEFIQSTLTGKISVASGKAVLAKGIKVTSKEGEGETLIVVSARVGEPGGAGK
jgi:type II secretory pathway component GspD/PulD (secretin)